MTLRAALYARVSTVGQTSNDPWASLPRQQADLVALAERWRAVVALEVVEQGSGAKSERPGWQRVLAAIRAGEVDVLMAVAFDRLTRSERIGEWEDLKVELRQLGVRLITVKQGEVDLSGTADAETRSDIDAVMSKRERLVIRERTMGGRRRKGEAGGYTGHHPPFGYLTHYHPATGAKSFPIDEDRAEVVRLLYARLIAGATVAAIARELNAAGVQAPGSWGAVAHHWYNETVRDMLSNPVYAGLSSWHRGKVAPIPSTAFEPIVSREMWDEAQSALYAARVRSPRGPKQPKPLSGILRCASCGGRMAFHKGHGRNADLYQCHADRRVPEPCPARQHLKASLCEEVILSYLLERLPAYLDGAITSYKRNRKETQAAGPSAERLEREIGKLKARASKLVDWMLDDSENGAIFAGKLGEIQSRIKVLEAELVTAKRATLLTDSRTASRRALGGVAEVIKKGNLSPEDRRGLFASVVLQVVLVRTSRLYTVPQTLAVERLQLRNGEWL